MELSAKEFEQIVRNLALASTGAGSELRRAPRINHRARVSIMMVENGKVGLAEYVQMFNLSSRGVGFTHNEALNEGTQFLLRLPRDGQKPVSILSQVMHCRKIAGNSFSIGAEFICTAGDPARQAVPEEEVKRVSQKILSE